MSKKLLIFLIVFVLLTIIAGIFLLKAKNQSNISAKSLIKGYDVTVTNPDLYNHYKSLFNWKTIYIENLGYVPLEKVTINLTNIPQSFDITQTSANPPIIARSTSFQYNNAEKQLTISVYLNKEYILEKSTGTQLADYIESIAMYRIYFLSNIGNTNSLSRIDFLKKLTTIKGDEKNILTVNKQ